MTDAQLECCLDLMRRLPPSDVQDNLAGLVDLQPDLCEDLLSSIDQPLEIAVDPDSSREYLLCDFNRDGDSYRSPWSNKFFPPLDDGAVPSDELRKLEITANDMFNHYREMYYGGGLSSAYFWDLEEGFAGAILIKKVGDNEAKNLKEGSWDSIHVVEATPADGGDYTYKLTSTIMLALTVSGKGQGTSNLSGTLTRQVEEQRKVNDNSPHLVNIGQMIEDMELKMRNSMDQVYFGKNRDVINGLRHAKTASHEAYGMSMQAAIMAGIQDKKA